MKVITRFPPSPTGYFHIGSARTALFNYLFAKKHGGAMRLRFEDTDRERSKKEYEDDILEGLKWLGIEYSPGIERQSERADVYRPNLEKLIESGSAYEAEPADKNPEEKVVRFKNPNTTIVFSDAVRGEVKFDTTELKDFVIAKSKTEPLYHLAVVIDDYEMGVTHVIRGEDHISNTQRQILIMEALGFTRPVYAHIPLILASDRSKLSKRHGAVSINEYRKQGYLPEALTNYFALLGWTQPQGKEKFSLEEAMAEFELSDIHKSGAIFDLEKLKWLNREYILALPQETFEEEVRNRTVMLDWKITKKLVQHIRERVYTWSDINNVREEYNYCYESPVLNVAEISGKGSDAKNAAQHLTELKKMLAAVLFDNAYAIKTAVWDYATKEGRGAVLWPLRYILSGRARSLDPFAIAIIIGKEETLKRIDSALDIIK